MHLYWLLWPLARSSKYTHKYQLRRHEDLRNLRERNLWPLFIKSFLKWYHIPHFQTWVFSAGVVLGVCILYTHTLYTYNIYTVYIWYTYNIQINKYIYIQYKLQIQYIQIQYRIQNTKANTQIHTVYTHTLMEYPLKIVW